MKNVEETWGTFHITVNKIGRKWVHVTIPRSNGYKLEATVDKSSIADCKIDDEMDISGCLQREFNGYGAKAILVVMSKEKVEQAWGTNNLRTGGAGAYAFRTSLESVKDILQTFLERKKV